MQKIIVTTSGGIDSSVAAYLLKKEGWDVAGATMRLWEDNSRCDSKGRSGKNS